MLRGSEQRQERTLMAIGVGLLLCIALAAGIVVFKPFSGRATDQLDVSIETPYVGQGIIAGTPIVLHGVEIGRVTAVTSAAAGGVQLRTQLQPQPVKGLTDHFGIDFRPINYFGVPGINVVPATGGQPVRNGTAVRLIPKGNSTLSELLSEVGDVSASSLTPQLIKVIDRATQYTDGLNPLIETAVTVTRAVEAVQTVPTEQLLTNLSSSIATFPGFTDAVIVAGTRTHRFDYYPGKPLSSAASTGPKVEFPWLQDVATPSYGEIPPDYFQAHFVASLDIISGSLFGAVGKLVGSHVDDLFPLVNGIKAITDTVPPLLRPQDIAAKLLELRNRFEKLYAGNGEQHAVSVRVLLDSLPGVAAPMGVVTEGAP